MQLPLPTKYHTELQSGEALEVACLVAKKLSTHPEKKHHIWLQSGQDLQLHAYWQTCNYRFPKKHHRVAVMLKI